MSGFKDWLDGQDFDSKIEAESSFKKAYANLSNVATDFNNAIAKHMLAVSLEEGWLVDMGQQYRFVLKLKGKKGKEYEHILFRAYVATSGRISFDFNDPEPTECDGTDSAIVFNTVGRFLERDTTLGVIQQLISLTNTAALKKKIASRRASAKGQGRR